MKNRKQYLEEVIKLNNLEVFGKVKNYQIRYTKQNFTIRIAFKKVVCIIKGGK